MPSPQTFVSAAETFIAVVETADTRSRVEFVRDLERALVDLYAAGLTLDDVEPSDTSSSDARANHDVAGLQRRLAQMLGDLDFYNVVFDPYDLDAQPVTGSLADDIADIYRDLQDGFAALGDGETANAYWEWKFGFDCHWGRHAAEAIYALYNLHPRLIG